MLPTELTIKIPRNTLTKINSVQVNLFILF